MIELSPQYGLRHRLVFVTGLTSCWYLVLPLIWETSSPIRHTKNPLYQYPIGDGGGTTRIVLQACYERIGGGNSWLGSER